MDLGCGLAGSLGIWLANGAGVGAPIEDSFQLSEAFERTSQPIELGSVTGLARALLLQSATNIPNHHAHSGLKLDGERDALESQGNGFGSGSGCGCSRGFRCPGFGSPLSGLL